jgi:hypothetical protein
MGDKLLRLLRLLRTILLVIFAVICVTLSSRASEVPGKSTFPGISRKALSRTLEAVQPETLNPTTRTEAILSAGAVPMKSLWLVAGLGLIYCLRRPKKA